MAYYDMVIVGGGAVGLSLLSSLCKTSLKILVLESRAVSNLEDTNFSTNQDRFIVLSNSSKKVYQGIGCWAIMEPHCTPIDTVEVSTKGQYGTSHLTAKEIDLTALGYVISLYQLEKALECHLASLKEKILMDAHLIKTQWIDNEWHITYDHKGEAHTVKAACLIGSDGHHSIVRTQNHIGLTQKSYEYQALVGTVRVQAKPQSFERFLSKGAIAFLPLPQHQAVFIWTLPDKEAIELFEKTDAEFLSVLQETFGYRLGHLSKLGPKKKFPLTMSQAEIQGKSHPPLLLMGTAALSLHPIGAQGLNLSLRNIALFSKLIAASKEEFKEEIEAVISAYLKVVKADQASTIWLTDTLASYVSGGPFPLGLRALGLILFDTLKPLKKAFTNLNTGLGVI